MSSFLEMSICFLLVALLASVGFLIQLILRGRNESDLRAERARSESLLALRDSVQGMQGGIGTLLTESRAALDGRLDRVDDVLKGALRGLSRDLLHGLEQVRRDNSEKLEKIREAVDEKLQASLEARLGESFRSVSERLEQVSRGLGEMQTLASGVGDLRRVLLNVRTRGTFGETQLSALLEQVLARPQYDDNVATVPGSSERVEFAVRIPVPRAQRRAFSGDKTFASGPGERDFIHLPIDAKFPQEDYLRLEQAIEDADAPMAAEARKALRRRILDESHKIATKYLAPPHTTDVALLFLPTEGLYAEVLRQPGLLEDLHRRKVIVVGPSTLLAVLSSLQMGFRALALERRGNEVWQVLGHVKTEFAKFGNALTDVKEKLEQAARKIDSASVRSRALERALRDVETLSSEEDSEEGNPILRPAAVGEELAAV